MSSFSVPILNGQYQYHAKSRGGEVGAWEEMVEKGEGEEAAGEATGICVSCNIVFVYLNLYWNLYL